MRPAALGSLALFIILVVVIILFIVIIRDISSFAIRLWVVVYVCVCVCMRAGAGAQFDHSCITILRAHVCLWLCKRACRVPKLRGDLNQLTQLSTRGSTY